MKQIYDLEQLVWLAILNNSPHLKTYREELLKQIKKYSDKYLHSS